MHKYKHNYLHGKKKLYTDNTICNLTHECIYLHFQNHRQRSMKRNFIIILTLLTSTETQLTQARFKLAPSEHGQLLCQWTVCSVIWSNEVITHHWGQDWFENYCTWKQFVNTLPNVVGFLRALRLIPSAGKVNLTGWVRVKRIFFFMSRNMQSKLTATDLTCFIAMGDFYFSICFSPKCT